MNKRQLLDAIDVLGWVGDRMGGLPEEQKAAVLARLQIQVAQSFLLELVGHMVDGVEPYDALLATVRGETPIDDEGGK